MEVHSELLRFEKLFRCLLVLRVAPGWESRTRVAYEVQSRRPAGDKGNAHSLTVSELVGEVAVKEGLC